ncbi:MAG: cation:proton antiporter [Arcobacteraceae bacterium]|jgi:Kef-type K+ transport system membrane component KefB|nr:cation:proton antiporter [Arcobacteraceae bacterium]
MEKIYLIITISSIIMFSPMIANLIKAPIVVIEIFLGMMAGFFGLIYGDDMLKIISKFGFLYLMFLAGLEINFKLVKIIKKDLSFNVALYFTFLYSLAAITCFAFDLSVVYLVALPIFSLGMLMMLIKEYGKEENWLNLALSIGVVGEVVSILALTIFSGWLEFGFNFNFFSSILTLGIVIFAIVLILNFFKILFWWYPELKTQIMPDADKQDRDVRFAFALFFILIALMFYLKIDVVLGAFTAGLFLKIFFHNKEELFEKLSSIGFGFFVPIFFIYTGSTVKLDMITADIFYNALYIILAIISIRFLSSFVAFYSYLKLKNTILFALSDSMPLTFLVAISMLGYSHGIITQNEYFSFILASMIDGLFLMIVIRKLYGWFGFEKNKIIATHNG